MIRLVNASFLHSEFATTIIVNKIGSVSEASRDRILAIVKQLNPSVKIIHSKVLIYIHGLEREQDLNLGCVLLDHR